MQIKLKRDILLEKKGNSSLENCALLSYVSEDSKEILIFGSAKPMIKKKESNSRFRNIGVGFDYGDFTIELPYDSNSLKLVNLIKPIYENKGLINYTNNKKDFEVSFFDNFGKLRLTNKMIGCLISNCEIHNSFLQKITLNIQFDYIITDYIDIS